MSARELAEQAVKLAGYASANAVVPARQQQSEAYALASQAHSLASLAQSMIDLIDMLQLLKDLRGEV